MILYKYCGPFGISALANNCLKASPFSELNDPFEYCPRSNTEEHYIFIKSLHEDPKKLKSYYRTQKELGEIGPDVTIDSIRNSIELVVFGMGGPLRQVLSTFTNHQPGRIVQRGTAQHYAVCCFSTDPKNILMWSHYAASHTGMVIGFDFRRPVFYTKRLSGPYRVDYTKDRPAVKWSVTQPWGFTPQNHSEAVLTKAHSWKYEKEWRCLFAIRNHKRKRLENGTAAHLFRFRPGSVCKVICGMQMSFDDHLKLGKLLKLRSLSHVEVYDARMDEQKYGIRLFRRR
ncbi:MAG TPA: DUF2971 domain-containing protein [Kiritimatiellia bacterium]|nr:DUF2971 domain-containing protein [Kiritimatiellia bacterium]HMP33676.1 DUF2971 domain-containing protein [Kiritimatiellia bacterium]